MQHYLNAYLIAVFLVASIFLIPLPAFSAFPSQVVPGSGTDVSGYKYQLLGYQPNAFIDFGSNFYATSVTVHSQYVNFANAALQGMTYPTKTFGIGTKDGNATVNTVDAGNVVLSMHCTPASRCDAFYYYSVVPNSVVFNINGLETTVSSFQTNFTQFDSGSSPAVYHNSTGGYLQAKLIYQTPSNVAFKSGVFIYADLGTSKPIKTIRIYKPDVAAIPLSINVYVTNDLTNWGSPLRGGYALSQSTGVEDIAVAETIGRYVKIEANVFGEADSMQLSEFELSAIDSTTAVDPWTATLPTVMNGFFIAMAVVAIGVTALVLRFIQI